MWKPGSAKPQAKGSQTPPTKQHKQHKQNNNNKNSGGQHRPLHLPEAPPVTTTTSQSSSTKKRLSGATMNMRFMKRKKETEEFDRRRQSAGTNDAAAAASPLPNPPAAPPPPSSSTQGTVAPLETQTTQQQRSQDMDVDEQVGSSERYGQATPADMYGMQASLIGRRSFGGFHATMEEAWKDSKASLENRWTEKPKQKVTDEELLQRYQDIVQKRSHSSRPIGNLQDKQSSQRRNPQ